MWWLTVDSVSPRMSARSPLMISPSAALNSWDMILTRTGSARALSLSATSNACSSVMGPAATGAQQTGVEISTMGSALCMVPASPMG